jgi:uncharacterized protein (TIRG00374 family)
MSNQGPPQNATKSRVGSVFRVACSFAGGALAAAAFYLLRLDPKIVAGHILAAPWWITLGCIASGFVLFGLQSLRQYIVMQPLLGLRYTQALRAQIVGAMFNVLLPARSGDLLRVQYLSRRTGGSRPAILGAQVVDRWLDWCGWFPIVLALAVTSILPRWVYWTFALLAALLAAWGGGMILLSRSGVVLRQDSRLGKMIQSFRGGVQAFRSRRTVILGLAVSPLPWLWESLALEWAGHAFGVHLSFAMAFCVLVGFNIGTIVPSPGSIGSLETGGTAVLASFGVDPSAALAFVTVYHFAQLLPTVTAGIAILLAEGEVLFGAGAGRRNPTALPSLSSPHA